MFCATDGCDNDLTEWCFLPKQMVTKNKLCDTNKNVTKMSVITKEGGFVCVW